MANATYYDLDKQVVMLHYYSCPQAKLATITSSGEPDSSIERYLFRLCESNSEQRFESTRVFLSE
jgi:hypothetical protein